MRALRLLWMLLAAMVAMGQNQIQDPLKVQPGATITVTVPGLNTNDKVSVKLNPVPNPPETTPQCGQQEIQPSSITITGPTATNLSLAVPPTACPGLYQIIILRTQAVSTVTDNLVASSPNFVHVFQKAPTVSGVSPKVIYAGDPMALTFLGPSSLKLLQGYTLRFTGRALLPCSNNNASSGQGGQIIGEGVDNNQSGATSTRSAGSSDTSSNTGTAQNNQDCFQPEPSKSQDGQISFSLHGVNFLAHLAGKQSVSLVYQGAESTPQDVVFVNASRTTPRNYALGVTAVLVLLIFVLLNAARKAMAIGARQGTFLLTALFLDEQTQTYSLSKCQFYAWTLAAILGYVFFSVARSVVQGSATFPDIPGGLPAILLFSASTSVAATAITSSKGSKGAGEIHPTLGDFITTGTVVAPERLQFVLWTAVGVFTFLTIVFKSDPFTLSDLPEVPPGFLQLMGISSAGYLAGKLARKAGPVIKALSVTSVDPIDYDPPAHPHPPAPQPVLKLNLKGQNLEPKAKIKVDGQALRGDMFAVEGVDAPDPQSGFCTELNVTLNSATSYIEGSHTLTVVNGDAQAADVTFPIDYMYIVSMDVPAGPNPVAAPANAAVKGKNFVSPTQFRWYDQAGAPGAGLADATLVSDTELTVTRPSNAVAGSKYRLTLVSSKGLRASKDV
jgi:hypothetical protein